MKLLTYQHVLAITLGLSLISCADKQSSSAQTDYGDWTLESTVVKEVGGHEFRFPSSGYAFENREDYVQQSLDAIKADCQLVGIDSFSVPMKVRFVNSRDEMKRYTGIAASGTANSWSREIHFAVFDSTETTTDEVITNPPILHEMMHMISQITWGYPGPHRAWINEGLATYAAGNCSGWTPQEMYRFFMENDMLAPMDSMTSNFYQVDEMVGYHQGAVWVEYMISNYGIESFIEFWRPEITTTFEEIYGISIADMEAAINAYVLETVPEVPAIDWEIQKEGCYTRLNKG